MNSERLSQHDALTLAEMVSDVIEARVPLSMGLRAAAHETVRPRVARELRVIADEVEAGRRLEEVLQARHSRVPRFVAGTMAAALRTGNATAVLLELVEQQRLAREAWTMVLSALMYPILLLALTMLLALLASLYAIEPFAQLFEDFELVLPPATMSVIWWGRTGVWLVLRLAVIGLLAALGARLALGAARWRYVLGAMPLLGGLWQWSAVANMARLLAVLVRAGVPLPLALQLTADGLGDANLREQCQKIAEEVAQGRRLSESVASNSRLPASIVPMLRWGEAQGRLAETLLSISDMMSSRLQMRVALLRSILPPLLFLVIWSAASFLIVGLFMPLTSLIQALS